MSLELKTNTAVRIPVGPLVDPDDGKTAEIGLTVTALSVQLYQIKTDGTAIVRTQFAPTASGGSNDMVLVTSSTDGMYDLELTATQLNWLGSGKITFYDVDGFLVHFIDIHVVSAAYFNYKYGSTSPLDEALTDLSSGDLDDDASSITAAQALRGVFNRLFRKVTQTSTTQTVYNDSGTSIATMACSEASGTQTKETAT